MGYALKREFLPNNTYSDYKLWEGNWELIDGIPFSLMPSGTFIHQRTIGNILFQLDSHIADSDSQTFVFSFDWKVRENTVVRPDVVVVRKPVTNDNHLEIPPVLIFEVLSPASQLKDRNIKFNIYQSEGVKYYVIIDLEKQTAEVFELAKKTYKPVLKTKDKNFIFKLDGCEADFDFSKIWR